jgi:CBS domain containing-hemolysin-like protein
MDIIRELWPWFSAMLVLVVLSGFFSCSEAALFYLKPAQRLKMSRGSSSQRAAVKLMENPDRLLSGILFYNLAINVLFFSISSICSIRLELSPDHGSVFAVAFGGASLLTIIFLGEMFPKTIAVLLPAILSQWVALPLAVAIRLISPIAPLLEKINLVSRRILWPGFQPEKYLDSGDLEKAIEISGADSTLVRQEQAALRNMVELSSIRVDEWMRPRTQFEVFRQPVSLADLEERVPDGGHLLVAEPDSDEIALAVRLDGFRELPATNLEQLASPVVYLPWCATVADALQAMTKEEREVTVIVNEYGETTGVLTMDDILATVFTYAPSRSKRLLDRNPLHPVDENRWIVSGIMSLRQLARRLEVEIPRTHSVTVAGIIQETMQRMAQVGDQCQWGSFNFRVIDIAGPGNMAVELILDRSRGEEPS